MCTAPAPRSPRPGGLESSRRLSGRRGASASGQGPCDCIQHSCTRPCRLRWYLSVLDMAGGGGTTSLAMSDVMPNSGSAGPPAMPSPRLAPCPKRAKHKHVFGSSIGRSAADRTVWPVRRRHSRASIFLQPQPLPATAQPAGAPRSPGPGLHAHTQRAPCAGRVEQRIALLYHNRRLLLTWPAPSLPTLPDLILVPLRFHRPIAITHPT